MKKIGMVAIVLAFGAMFLMVLTCMSPAVSASAGTYKTHLISPEVTKIPVLDGKFTTSTEWSSAEKTRWYFTPETNHSAGYIYIYAMNIYVNNYNYLCLCFDITCDNTSDSSDYIGFAFDENHDGHFNGHSNAGGINDGVGSETFLMDKRSGVVAYSQNSKDGIYVGTEKITNEFTVNWGFGTSPNSGVNHTTYEVSIPITFFSYDANHKILDTMGFYAEGNFGDNRNVFDGNPEWCFPRNANSFVNLLGKEDTFTDNWGTLNMTVTNNTPPAPASPPPPVTPSPIPPEAPYIIIIVAGISAAVSYNVISRYRHNSSWATPETRSQLYTAARVFNTIVYSCMGGVVGVAIAHIMNWGYW